MQPSQSNDSSAGLAILPVEHLPEYVSGFPAYVAITVSAPRNTHYKSLLFADFADLRGAVGLELTGRDGTVVRYVPTPRVNEEAGRYPQNLDGGESRRMLADISSLLGPDLEGEYQARFSFVTPREAIAAAPVTVRFRKPSAAEKALLTSAAPDRASYPDWGTWAISCPAEAVSAGHFQALNPLSFALALRYLLCGDEPLDRIDPAILDVLTGLYAPEAKALRAELSKLCGDVAAWQGLRSEIIQQTPGLAFWMRMIDEDSGYVAALSTRPASAAR